MVKEDKMITVVIIADIPETAENDIIQSFPAGWTVHITDAEHAEKFLPEADAVIPEHIPVNDAFLQKAEKLRIVQTGAGYDNVDIEACTRRGIPVCNAAGINADAVAEHTIAMILCQYKNIAKLDAFMKAHGNEKELVYKGSELMGKTIGIIGLGEIGQKVAKLCNAFGMTVLGYNHHPKTVHGVESVELDELYRRSDIVSVHVPLNATTNHMLNQSAFARMQSHALLINTSRGPVVNEADLIHALKHREISGACLDVFEQEPLSQTSPLREMPNVILTPHTAGLPDGVKFHRKRYDFFVENIRKAVNGELPEHLLNRVDVFSNIGGFMSQKERMMAGLPYKAWMDGLSEERLENKKKIFRFNNLEPGNYEEKDKLLREILGKTGENINIEAPFHCDYGYNIEVGENFFANYNFTVLDVGKVRIGANAQIAPNVSIYTAGHPVHPESRNSGYEYGIGITIGDNVWIGGNVCILPGVTIGNNVVIGAGSVVTKDIPDSVIAVGNPCRAVREITEDDRDTYYRDKRFDVDDY